MVHGDLAYDISGNKRGDLAWDSSLMGWIFGGMVYDDTCGRAWPCIGGEFHDFVADLELPWDPPGSKTLTDLDRSSVLLPADDVAAPTCSKNRTCTTTRKRNISFCTVCMQVSVDSLLQSISRYILFLSLLFIPGCSFRYMSMAR